LKVLLTRPEIGSQNLGTNENGTALILLPGEWLDKLEASDSFHIDNVDTEYRHLKAGRVEFPNLLKELTQEEMVACIHTCDPTSHIVELCSLLQATTIGDSRYRYNESIVSSIA
jgi:hypothetical protein